MLELLLIFNMLNVQLHRFRRRLSPSRVNRNPDAKDSEQTATPLLDPDSINKRSSRISDESNPTPPPDTTRRARRRQRAIRVPRMSHKSSIVQSPDLVAPLHSHLPARYQGSDWHNVYSTMRHGISLKTFYANCAGTDPIIVLIRDEGGSVFGTYTSVPWKSSKQYYGTGEGFVFTISPEFSVYKWSRQNSFFQLGSGESIALGGGGKFAIFLDSMLEYGSSGPCATFNSPCLASKSEFRCVVLEAYKLISPYRFKNIDQD